MKLLSVLFALLWAAGQQAIAAKQPNILFILTDDQDLHMHSLEYMPLLQKHLVKEGTLFLKHFCTVAICCPSRANLWTGKAAHNTNVTDVFPPYGGYPKVVSQGINNNYLPIWLQNAGYHTYYTGKLWNAHNVDNYNAPYVAGFNESDFLLDPYTYDYLNAHMTRNGAPPASYKGQYSPDVTATKAATFLDEALLHPERPWFVVHAPVAPHSNFGFGNDGYQESDAPKYAARHAHLFKDYKIPRTENFNPEKQGGVSWIKKLPRLNQTVLDYNDEFQRSRLRALQAVDESVEQLIQKVEKAGQLDNTYIFYTTDNGYHISQYRLHPGKECGFDTDINIPLIVRGPGVPAGRVSTAVSAHTDLASTILTLAGAPRDDSDGTSIPLSEEEEQTARHDHVTIEFWGLGIPEGKWGDYGDFNRSDGFGSLRHTVGNNTYKGLRVVSEDYSLYYSVWCTNETELYDVKSDPGQLHNLLSPEYEHIAATFTIAGRPFREIVPRLDALVLVLKSCKGETCIHPWKELHPDGDVHSLVDALGPRFDVFYERQPKVSFLKCELGFIKESEGPLEPNQFPTAETYSEEEKETLRKQGIPVSFRYQGPIGFWT
ncbi:Arylsulphatase [Rhizodiscina lignyota]|uniref:Arylsulfatase n=1 Tax=Rhizodiscina lignyota TaxID=1504668 RepID=A0A9P4IJS3_9PEZI|nr:Arylsulphatase [Rhizodiscina lignyota]